MLKPTSFQIPGVAILLKPEKERDHIYHVEPTVGPITCPNGVFVMTAQSAWVTLSSFSHRYCDHNEVDLIIRLKFRRA